MDLYGFIDPADRDFFEILLTVSGVGPKTALGVLRKTPREQMQGALARRDLSYLTRVAGLSRKSAEKMMAELSEKLESKKDGGNDEDAEVFETLLALGYTEREARKALGTLPDALLGKEARLRAALSNGR
jgi:Holliday junction DNA helicase RuvA